MADQAQGDSWKHRLFVVGHVAKGLVFCMIGGLGTYAVVRGGGDPRGMMDVLVWLHSQAFGLAMVLILGLGLLAHGVWRWWKVFAGETNSDSKLVGIGERIGHVVGGAFYMLLCVFSFSLLWVQPKTNSDEGSTDQALAFTLKIPWGEWIIGLIGAIIIVVGIIVAVQGRKQQVMSELGGADMAKWERKAYRIIGMGGHLAWGLVNAVIGYFLIRVALTHDPEKYRGIKGALVFVGGRTFGTLLLGSVSMGLLLFGLFMFAKARYERT